MLISVIIPCYNEQEAIIESYRRLQSVFINDLPTHCYEFIFINDGSKDRTLFMLKELTQMDPQVRIINFSRNFGHQSAITAGLIHCKGDAAVIIDADLQDPPEVIPAMLELLNEHECSVVYGVRLSRDGESRFKLFTAKVFYRILNKLSDVKFPTDTGDFRIVDSKVINAFRLFPEKNKYVRGLISWIGYKQVPFFYDRAPRLAGESKFTFLKMLKFASVAILYFSTKPLKFAIGIGGVSIFFSMLGVFFIILLKVFWSSIVISWWWGVLLATIFMGGVQLLTIGVVSHYIGKLFDEVKDRPEYIMDEI